MYYKAFKNLNKQRLDILDLFRALAALEVVISHLRTLFFNDFPSLHNPGIITKVFYYLSNFGHESVIVFFVLSGYFVGGSVLVAKQEDFWARYLSQRLARLWIVLIPSLLLTLLWNKFGLVSGGDAYLHGRLNPPISVAPRGAAIGLGFNVFIGNVFFLQDIVVPVYGDNGPLWSLANEFWYYLAFPLLYKGFQKVRLKRFLGGSVSLAAGLSILYLVPRDIFLLFGVWVLGVVVFGVTKSRLSNCASNYLLMLGGSASLLASLHLSRIGAGSDLSGFISRRVMLDFFVGISFASILPFFINRVNVNTMIGKVFGWISDFSYTLYLVHFSFISFVWYTFFHSKRIDPSVRSVLVVTLVLIFTMSFAWVVARVFERNTSRLRDLMLRRLSVDSSRFV